ncbi:MAG: NAD(P)/FAD-dependent oxidoreductase [Candidatus Paracaedibacteraceae bacterium]|nr:NAD(P)/FAD-dependent oxidoreductase [Candidatus Paracaedibacteraceae bacterium]
MTHFDCIIIGAGAAGLMTALTAGQRGKSVLLLEHTSKIGEKIRISGGGRCNFTNINATPANYICPNPHFVKSALASYTQHDFIALVKKHKIAFHEKTLGQLFCDDSSKQIIALLLDECALGNVVIKKNCSVQDIQKSDTYSVMTTQGTFSSPAVVIATGGLSIPQIGASDFAYRIAKQFNIPVKPTRPALAPLTVSGTTLAHFKSLSGVSNDSITRFDKTQFRENILFTHRGLSGPAILQISSYLPDFNNRVIHLNLIPKLDLNESFIQDKDSKKTLTNYVRQFLSDRLVDHLATTPLWQKTLTEIKKTDLCEIANTLHNFPVTITGSEGYQKAEVTVGGVDTDHLSSKTMMCHAVSGLYFVGEAVDVTGWLGGYNFQWAWSSGNAAGRSV